MTYCMRMYFTSIYFCGDAFRKTMFNIFDIIESCFLCNVHLKENIVNMLFVAFVCYLCASLFS